MARALRAWAINPTEKTRSVTYSTDLENEVSKRYISEFRNLATIVFNSFEKSLETSSVLILELEFRP